MSFRVSIEKKFSHSFASSQHDLSEFGKKLIKCPAAAESEKSSMFNFENVVLIENSSLVFSWPDCYVTTYQSFEITV